MGRGRRVIKNTCEESRVERPISRREKKRAVTNLQFKQELGNKIILGIRSSW
jgi:hypothetical protein